MKVAELIAELSKCPPEAQVRMFVSWEDQRLIDSISPEDCDGFVLVGHDLPPEKWARDYKE